MLYYISNADFPGQKAHTIQQVRMCQAFEHAGENVCLVHPGDGNPQKRVNWEDIAEYYGLDTEFEIQTVPTLHSRLQSVPQIGLLSMAGSITVWLVSRVITGTIDDSDIIYGRNYYGMFLFNELRRILPASRCPQLVFENHIPISAHLKPRFFRSTDGLVCITHKLKEYLIEQYGIQGSNVLVAPDGVDLDPYTGLSKSEARERLGLPANENIVMYTGHLYRGKGVETLVEAAEELDALVYVVGGYDEDINRVKREAGHPENVDFTGFVQPSDIPTYQMAADMLVAPYTEESRPWVSPLKLFEYMAARRPIVASDREVLREVLTDGQNAAIFEKGNANALREALASVLVSNSLQQTLVANAQETVDKYTWHNRAQRILDWATQIDTGEAT